MNLTRLPALVLAMFALAGPIEATACADAECSTDCECVCHLAANVPAAQSTAVAIACVPDWSRTQDPLAQDRLSAADIFRPPPSV